MIGPRKRFWKRIVITIDSDSSDDDSPQCKAPKLNSVEHVTQNKSEKTARKRQEILGSSDGVCNNHNQVVKKRRNDLVIRCVILNNISALYQKAVSGVYETCLYRFTSYHLQFLSKFSSQLVVKDLTIHSSTSTVHTLYLLQNFVTIIEDTTGRSQCSAKSSMELKSMLRRSGIAVWASWLAITNLMWINGPDCGMFVKAVQSIMKFCQSQVKILRSTIALLDEIEFSQCMIEFRVEALYKNIVYLALCVNKLLIKKNLQIEEFVLIAIDIALLPTFGGNTREQPQSCLYLVRSVLKSQNGCWQKFVAKVYSAMFQSSTWNKKFSLPLDSGKRVNKSTLVLLTLIQSSVDIPKMHINACGDFIRSISSDDMKQLVKGLIQDDLEDSFVSQKTKDMCVLLGCVLNNADFIIRYFYSQVKKNVLLGRLKCLSENFKRFLEDLFILMGNSQWPAAEYVLIALCNFMVGSLKENELPKWSCEFLFKCLGNIFVKLGDLFSSLEQDCDDFAAESNMQAVESKNLLFLQVELLAYVARQCKDKSFQDNCLFYLAVWFMDKNTKKLENEVQQHSNEVSWQSSRFVNNKNINRVVNRITASRRSVDIRNVLNEVVELESSTVQCMAKNVINLLVRLCESNARIFVEESVVKRYCLPHCDGKPIQQRRAIVRCLNAYLLNRPEKFDDYFGTLCFYVSVSSMFDCVSELKRILCDVNFSQDKQVSSVRNAAVQVMATVGLQFYDNLKILRKCVLLLKSNTDYVDSAAQHFCKIIWLKPVGARDKTGLLENKVSLLINMFSLIEDSNYVEEVFPNLFRLETGRSENIRKRQLKACEQIVDGIAKRCLKRTIFQDAHDSRKVVASFQLLSLFAKITPGPLVTRYSTLWQSLDRQCQVSQAGLPDVDLMTATTKAMKATFPCISNPEESILWRVNLSSFIVSNRFNKSAIISGLEHVCLVENLRGKNAMLQTYWKFCLCTMTCCRSIYEFSSMKKFHRVIGRLIQRNMIIFGVLFSNLELHGKDTYQVNMEELFLNVFLEYMAHCGSADVALRQTALFALGSICLRHHWMIAVDDVKSVYLKILESDAPDCILIQVLQNIYEFFRSLIEYTDEKTCHVRKPGLVDLYGNPLTKSVRRTVSEIAQVVIHTYFEAAKMRYFHKNKAVRLAVLELVLVVEKIKVLQYSEVIPLLAAMVCDPEKYISHRAERELATRLEKKNVECINGAFCGALSMSSVLSRKITPISDPIQGYYVDDGGTPLPRLNVLNSMIVRSKIGDIDFTSPVMNRFSVNQGACIFDLLYCAGNLVYFEYKRRREIVSIIQRIDFLVSSIGKKTIESFKKILRNSSGESAPSLSIHQKMVSESLKLILLMEMKLFLFEMYGIQQVEVSKLESNKAYRIELKLGKETAYVSDRSYAKRVSKYSSAIRFAPAMSSQMATRDDTASCCGRNFSRKTLVRLCIRPLSGCWGAQKALKLKHAPYEGISHHNCTATPFLRGWVFCARVAFYSINDGEKLGSNDYYKSWDELNFYL